MCYSISGKRRCFDLQPTSSIEFGRRGSLGPDSMKEQDPPSKSDALSPHVADLSLHSKQTCGGACVASESIVAYTTLPVFLVQGLL